MSAWMSEEDRKALLKDKEREARVEEAGVIYGACLTTGILVGPIGILAGAGIGVAAGAAYYLFHRLTESSEK